MVWRLTRRIRTSLLLAAAIQAMTAWRRLSVRAAAACVSWRLIPACRTAVQQQIPGRSSRVCSRLIMARRKRFTSLKWTRASFALRRRSSSVRLAALALCAYARTSGARLTDAACRWILPGRSVLFRRSWCFWPWALQAASSACSMSSALRRQAMAALLRTSAATRRA